MQSRVCAGVLWCVVVLARVLFVCVVKEQKEFKPSAAFCKNRKKISELRGLDFGSDFFQKTGLGKQTKKMRSVEKSEPGFFEGSHRCSCNGLGKRKFWVLLVKKQKGFRQ